MEEDYEVEKILYKKQDNGVWYYLIKWVNYGFEENTWEPTENIKRDCEEMVKKFEKDWEEKKKKKVQKKIVQKKK